MMNVERDGDGGTRSARRRRQRRFRSFLRHERMAVAMALAERLHHSANVTDSKEEEEVEQVWYNALRGQKTARAGGGLPAPLSEVAGRQEVLVRHVVEHMADVCPVVQTLDAPVPQMVDTVLEFFRALDLPVDEQVIAVPKISTDRVSQRLVERRLPQIVEQLVEVPTIISYSSLFQQTLEQNVDIPTSVHGVSGSLQGFLPEEYSSQRTASQIADIPVPGRGGSGSRLGFPAEQSTTALHVSQERISERIKQIGSGGDFPSHRAGLHGFLPGQSSAARLGTDVRGGGLQGSVPEQGSTVPLGAQSGVGRQRPRPGQGSTALRGRRFAGQVFVEPDAAGRVGFIESASAQAELACGGDFRFSASYLGRFFTGDDVTLSARQLPTGRWEAFDLAEL